jgi:hypothetical protein
MEEVLEEGLLDTYVKSNWGNELDLFCFKSMIVVDLLGN